MSGKNIPWLSTGCKGLQVRTYDPPKNPRYRFRKRISGKLYVCAIEYPKEEDAIEISKILNDTPPDSWKRAISDFWFLKIQEKASFILYVVN